MKENEGEEATEERSVSGKRSENEKRRAMEEEKKEEEEEAGKDEEKSDEDGSWSIYRARPLLIIHARDSRGVART